MTSVLPSLHRALQIEKSEPYRVWSLSCEPVSSFRAGGSLQKELSPILTAAHISESGYAIGSKWPFQKLQNIFHFSWISVHGLITWHRSIEIPVIGLLQTLETTITEERHWHVGLVYEVRNKVRNQSCAHHSLVRVELRQTMTTFLLNNNFMTSQSVNNSRIIFTARGPLKRWEKRGGESLRWTIQSISSFPRSLLPKTDPLEGLPHWRGQQENLLPTQTDFLGSTQLLKGGRGLSVR